MLAPPRAAAEAYAAARIHCPHALAACVLPDHIHIVVLGPESAARAAANRVVRSFSARMRVADVWDEPGVKPILNTKHLRRALRYSALNPVRARLIADPLAWPWSTHRGAIGAEAIPWVSAREMCTAIGVSTADPARWWHDRVGVDADSGLLRSPFPAPPASTRVARIPLERIVCAARSATLWEPEMQRRATCVELALEQGWRDTRVLSEALGVAGSTIDRYKSRSGAREDAMRAARLCLGDERLTLPASAIDALLQVLRERRRLVRRASPPNATRASGA